MNRFAKRLLTVLTLYSFISVPSIEGHLCNSLFNMSIYLQASKKLVCVYVDINRIYNQQAAIARCRDQLNSRMLYIAEEIDAIVQGALNGSFPPTEVWTGLTDR